jgi:mRNA interferase HigB
MAPFAGDPVAPKTGAGYRVCRVRVISRRILRDFWQGHGDAEQPLRAWFAEVSRANWASMADIKRRYPSASMIDAERVVFNVGGNKFRLVVKVWFPGQAVWIKFIGTHRQYDRIDVRKV